MPSREYHEAIWQAVPEGRLPEDFALRRRFLLEHVRAGQRVLDVGCGEGAFAVELRKAGADVLAVDLAEEPLRRAARRDPGLELAPLSSEGAWGLPDAVFDVVWAGEVIEHVADTVAWMSELRRVLRPGGVLVASTPANGTAQLLAAALSHRAFVRRFDPRSDHLRFYSRATLTALIADYGFERITVDGAGGPPWARRRLLAAAVRSRY